MVENGQQTDTPKPNQPKKGVSIQIMFPCESDDEAMEVKRAIDHAMLPFTEKRYTFSISEV